ncbi:DUF3967 domain-containing protein [Bacillus thuringiensis]|uniref:DUF3967 domain-containing protein n=1 Tax=Bacillus thuringiensis TaxID=1428 RepID=UPI0011AA50B9|nr:DUF3967 domain-containing protein [Bacillus thuringiensis]
MKVYYGPQDVCIQLGIQPSTLRKYADVLEKEGYTFTKTDRGHRKYKESDIIVFRKLIDLKNDTDMTLEVATKQIVLWYRGIEVMPLDIHELERYEDTNFNATVLCKMIQAQGELIENQNELLHTLTQKLDEQDLKLIQRDMELFNAIRTIQECQNLMLNRNEDAVKLYSDKVTKRDEMLLQTVREIQEMKHILAATQEKKPWWRFW